MVIDEGEDFVLIESRMRRRLIEPEDFFWLIQSALLILSIIDTGPPWTNLTLEDSQLYHLLSQSFKGGP